MYQHWLKIKQSLAFWDVERASTLEFTALVDDSSTKFWLMQKAENFAVTSFAGKAGGCWSPWTIIYKWLLTFTSKVISHTSFQQTHTKCIQQPDSIATQQFKTTGSSFSCFFKVTRSSLFTWMVRNTMRRKKCGVKWWLSDCSGQMGMHQH